MPVKKIIKAVLPGRAGNAPGGQTIKRINLALQGGGAHGAFTWGVLEHLLDDDRLVIEGISGTSAGAMNAIMLADGLSARRPPRKRRSGSPISGARSAAAAICRPCSAPWSNACCRSCRSKARRCRPGSTLMSRYFSPYDFNPLNINPLKDLIERFVDFEAVRIVRRPSACSFPRPMCRPAGVRIFPREKITADAVMASACLPFLFRAVEIDGVPYWDGGYLGNPVIFPFFGTTETEDVLVVQINPLMRHTTPKSCQEIMNRLNEITFNSSLLAEYRAIEFVAPADRSGPAAARHRARRVPPHQRASHRARPRRQEARRIRERGSNDYDFFELLRRTAGARRGVFSTNISTISA